MKRIILSGVHCTGKTTIAKKLTETLKSQGFNTRLYSNDNFLIYRNCDVFSSQIDRLFFGQRKEKEATQESPEIALFDRSLIDNIIYSRCFNTFTQPNGDKYLSDNNLMSILRIYQMIEERKNRLDSTIIFLNPPLEQMVTNIQLRGREKGHILENEAFITCLKKMFEAHYKYHVDSPIIELKEYTEHTIVELLLQQDIIQTNYC